MRDDHALLGPSRLQLSRSCSGSSRSSSRSGAACSSSRPGLALWLDRRTRRLVPGRRAVTLMLVFTAGLVLVYSKWWAWYGGLAWGPRFFLFAAVPRLVAPRGADPPRRRLGTGGRAHARRARALGLGRVRGAIADLGALSFCTSDGVNATEQLCWFTPDYSSLWQPVREAGWLSDPRGRSRSTAARLRLPRAAARAGLLRPARPRRCVARRLARLSVPTRPRSSLGPLAARAVPAPAAGEADPLDRRAAALAGLPGAPVDLELALHRARAAVGKGVVAERRALAGEPAPRARARIARCSAPQLGAARGSAPRAAGGAAPARAPRRRRCSRRPATVRWSRSAALTGARRPASRAPRSRGPERGLERLGAEARARGRASSSPGSSRSQVPKRRTSR